MLSQLSNGDIRRQYNLDNQTSLRLGSNNNNDVKIERHFVTVCLTQRISLPEMMNLFQSSNLLCDVYFHRKYVL